MSENEPLLEWTAIEHSPLEHNIDWYWTVGIIGCAISIGAIVVNNWLFAIVALLGTFVVIMNSLQEPTNVTCSITKTGIVVNKDVFPYNNLKSFSIDDRHHRPTLVLHTNGLLIHRVHVPLTGTHPNIVREALSHFAKEITHEHTFAEALGERIGIL